MEYSLKQTGYYPISLGSNCFSRMYIESIYKESYPRLPFDYVGSPMWGINKAIESKFKGFASKDTIDAIELHTNSKDLYLVNRDYMIAFLHDHKRHSRESLDKLSVNEYYKVENDYSRRIARWNSLVKVGSKLLFFRLQRPENNRIQTHINNPSEKESLEAFSRLMKVKGIEFKILYFTYNEPQHFDSDTDIIYVNIPKEEKITNNLIKTLLSTIEIFRFVRGVLYCDIPQCD